ncbi:MAG: TGS domain-containing protein, partial [Clostridiales bacterium]|nr:TGS domain-containing protein [Clostridiales bacterium]
MSGVFFKLTLKDGSTKEVLRGTTVGDVIKSISEGLYRNAVGASINGALVDLRDEVQTDGSFVALTVSDPEGLEIYRHTAAHVLAQAVRTLFPDAKLAIGPATATGFYYDFDVSGGIKEDDFARIEAEMSAIIKKDLPIKKEDVAKKDAYALFTRRDEPYKLQLLDDIVADTVSVYSQ